MSALQRACTTLPKQKEKAVTASKEFPSRVTSRKTAGLVALRASRMNAATTVRTGH